jgi:hypothetical protein
MPKGIEKALQPSNKTQASAAKGTKNILTALSLAAGAWGLRSALAAETTALTRGGSLTSKVDKIINTIDEGGFKVTQNAKTATQEANVTITHPEEPGVKLNLRTEIHPLEPGGQSVRHVNVERVEPGPKNRPEVKSNTHIDQ